jgi:hypothetical protein
LTGWIATGINKYFKTYTANTGETVMFWDLAGNTGNVNINIANIDKIPPTCTVDYSTTLPTNGAVNVVLT